MTDRHRIAGGALSATIQAAGAELVSLRDGGGGEYLWQAGPAWRRHAPLLFPIVGRLPGDTLRHAGKSYRMTQHGFARDRRFAWASREADRCRLRLVDDAESRALYPFAFALEVEYRITGGRLAVRSQIANTGSVPLPCSFGAHPAFRWPLVEGAAKDAHRLTFAHEETGPSLRLEGGLLGYPEPNPVTGRELALNEALFERDALILPGVASRAVRYAAPDGTALLMEWEGYTDLGLWSKPEGADFLCIEPWSGMSSPKAWDGEFNDKPDIMHIAPNAQRSFQWSMEIKHGGSAPKPPPGG
ncbi:aldose epimerase [Pseudoroseomonas deserti]|uniref:Aldose epimerase n=1 Tax=Teichococcus deserti TaxID=1817963 RepID=A0A1V2H9H1_9PROT|nr:aldose 1-epimerase family protein [Pseudoroseomonas deserti]ONG58720.1 aldose epimerase [Pseudoroseomonas deserti]